MSTNDDLARHTVTVHAPSVAILTLVVESSRTGARSTIVMTRADHAWYATFAAEPGDCYWLVADGVGPLVDPSASDIRFRPSGPVCVVRPTPWPSEPTLGHHIENPVVYEIHAKGFAGTFAGASERLPYLAGLGVNVIEVMPIHPFDNTDNYWGYMPVVWGAVHRPYARSEDAAKEFAEFTRAAHSFGMEVWLDVVFNHTGEGDASMPTLSLRGLDDANAYRHHDDGRYTDDSGCGNDIDPSNLAVRALVFEALNRFADLGIDGFRFDLASLLTRDGGELVNGIGDWADDRDVVVVAEPWDLAAYQVGSAFPDPRWLQWNDRFRDDVRGYLRAEPGLVAALARRVCGSHDIFVGTQSAAAQTTQRSVNYLTAHDGLTLHDLTAVTSDRHRSWDCGAELRPQQLANAFCLLLLSSGSAMFVMGDEFARTQHGHDNPYNVDGVLTAVDWARLDEWRPLRDTVGKLIELRQLLEHGNVRCYGTHGAPDVSPESRSLAWASGGVYVVSNSWWDPLEFEIQEAGPWMLALATAQGANFDGERVQVPGRSTMVLRRDVSPL